MVSVDVGCLPEHDAELVFSVNAAELRAIERADT
jgi:hypothetical protein